MSGSGGGGFLGGDKPGEVARKLRDAERASAQQAFLVEVEAVLARVLADANSRDVEAVGRHLAVIKTAIERDVDGVVELMFGGSVAKHTYVEGLSDIDALVELSSSELAKKSPREVCEYLLARLAAALPNTVVEPDGFAITVRFADIPIQVVPAVRRGEDYLLPDETLSTWSSVRPRAFTDKLSDTNKHCNGKVVPTIKLAKVLLAAIPEDRRPIGYHVENLAVEVFAGYEGPYTPRAMLHRFFEKAPSLIRQPIRDRTGQSTHVDDYLGAADSVERLVVADVVDRIGRRLRNADASADVGQWERLFEATP